MGGIRDKQQSSGAIAVPGHIEGVGLARHGRDGVGRPGDAPSGINLQINAEMAVRFAGLA